jgi:hypothetical protein
MVVSVGDFVFIFFVQKNDIALIDAANIITLNFPRRRKDRRDRDLLYTIGNSLNLPDFPVFNGFKI